MNAVRTVLLRRVARDGPIRVTIGNASLGFLSNQELRHRLGYLAYAEIAAILADLDGDGGEYRLSLTGNSPIDRVLEYWRGHPSPDDL